MGKKIHILIVLIFITIIISGCSKKGDGSDDLSDDRGIECGKGNPYEMVWSKTNDIVYYIEKGTSIEYKNINSLEGGVLDATPDLFLNELEISNDGQYLYYIAKSNNGLFRSLIRIKTDGTGRTVLIPNSVSSKRVSPDGQIVIFNSSFYGVADGLYKFNIATQTTTQISNGYPLRFSPGGNEIVVKDNSILKMDLNGGNLSTIFIPSYDMNITNVHWDINGIKLIYRKGKDYFQFNHITNTTTKIFTTTNNYPNPFPALSPDGTRLSIWTQKCNKYNQNGGCDIEQFDLYIINPDTGKDSLYGNCKKPGDEAGLYSGHAILDSVQGKYCYGFGGKLYLK